MHRQIAYKKSVPKIASSNQTWAETKSHTHTHSNKTEKISQAAYRSVGTSFSESGLSISYPLVSWSGRHNSKTIKTYHLVTGAQKNFFRAIVVKKK